MSAIAAELVRVRGAFDQPTLTLLHQRQAPTVIALFRTCFARDRRTIVTAQMHTEVEAHLDLLRQQGQPEVPTGTAREVCMKWVRDQWLVRAQDESGNEHYSLTSHAQDALSLVKSLTRERASLSEHRITTILSTVRRFNADVNPDRAARVAILEKDIERLTAERDRLLRGGELAEVSDDYMLDGYNEIHELVAGLPSDFARVEEAFTRLRTDILAAFRADDRPAGQVLDDYLGRVDNLMTATPEGRAFEGAFGLLRDPDSLEQLRSDLDALLEHPVALDILKPGERRNLRGTIRVIQDGLQDVLSRRARVTTALRDYILTHDLTRDRELDGALRQVEAELTTWMRTAGPRASVPMTLPPKSRVEHLRERFYDPLEEAGPPPLAEPDDDTQPPSLHELQAHGGPSNAQLAAALAHALDGDTDVSLGQVFAELGTDLHRAVEIFGLLQESLEHPDMRTHEDLETYETRRPDGTQRTLSMPRVARTAAAGDTAQSPNGTSRQDRS